MLKIKVPATSANLGPGFDSIGMALNIYNYITIDDCDNPIEIINNRKDNLFKDKDNLIYKTIQDFYDITGKGKVPNIKIIQEDNIPIIRGLGSSAACVVGGLYAGNYLAKTKLSKEDIADIASKIEGHPDNVTPAIMGGITVGALDNDKLTYIKLDMKNFEKLKIAVMIPNFYVKTELSRNILPKTYSIKDVVYNISRSALLVAALTSGDFKKLSVATKDMLHQPYRMSIINNMEDILKKAESFGAYGSFLSGAGPTLISFIDNNEYFVKMEGYLNRLSDGWVIKEALLDLDGTLITELEKGN